MSENVATSDIIQNINHKYGFNDSWSKKALTRKLAKEIFQIARPKQDSKKKTAAYLLNKYGSKSYSKSKLSQNITNDILSHEKSVPLTRSNLVTAVRYINKHNIKQADYNKVIKHMNRVTKPQSNLSKSDIESIVTKYLSNVPKSFTKSDANNITNDVETNVSVNKIEAILNKGLHTVKDNRKMNEKDFHNIIKDLVVNIGKQVMKGHSVYINNLGVFYRSEVKARPARTINSGLPTINGTIKIPAQPAHYTMHFRISKTLKNALKSIKD